VKTPTNSKPYHNLNHNAIPITSPSAIHNLAIPDPNYMLLYYINYKYITGLLSLICHSSFLEILAE